ncbi:hypothetical protein Mapa_010535 [Marchantia paleacea]|nr:hypothetical protein Mapa_010535 [Marchantia paleacea]
MKMVIVVGLLGTDLDLVQPLDRATTCEARYYEPNGKAMIWSQQISILLVRQQNVSRFVHSHLQRNAGAITGGTGTRCGVFACSFEFVSSRAANEVLDPSLFGHQHSTMLQHITKPCTAPNRGANSPRPPFEPQALATFAELLAAIAGAHERDRQPARWETQEISHGELLGFGHEPGDLDGPALPSCLGDSSMVAYEVQGRRGQEPKMHEGAQRRLTIERMEALDSDEVRMPGHPLVFRGQISPVQA